MTTSRLTIVPSLFLAGSLLVLSGCNDPAERSAANIVPASSHASTQDAGSAPAKAPEKTKTPPQRPKSNSDGDLKSKAANTTKIDPPAPHTHGAAPATAPVAAAPAGSLVKVEPSVLDMGQIPTNGSSTRNIKLTNVSNADVVVERIQGSCGCTAINFPANSTMKPGEEREVEIRVSGGPNASRLAGKKVTVFVTGQPPTEVQLSGDIVAFVAVTPQSVNLDTIGEAQTTMKIAATDGTAFRILSMQPPVVTDFGNEAKLEHEVVVNWDAFKKMGVGRQMMFFLDHPKCSQAMVNVMYRPVPATGETLAAAQAAAPPVPVDPMTEVMQLINDGNTAALMAKITSGNLTVEAANADGTTLLGLAAKAGQIDMINALLAAGADIEAKDNIGGTCMTWAAGLGDAETVQLLIDEGAEVDVVGLITGWTPLTWASGFGDAASIPLLVKAGANIEHGDFLQGATPLIHAIRTGSPEAVKALLAAGAKIEGRDNTGKTPFLAGAEASGCTAEKLKVLIEAGADIHAKDNRGLNGLQLARNRTDMRGPDMVALLEPLLGAETPATTTAAATPASTPSGSSGDVKQP